MNVLPCLELQKICQMVFMFLSRFAISGSFKEDRNVTYPLTRFY